MFQKKDKILLEMNHFSTKPMMPILMYMLVHLVHMMMIVQVDLNVDKLSLMGKLYDQFQEHVSKKECVELKLIMVEMKIL